MGGNQSSNVEPAAVEPKLLANTENHPWVAGSSLKFHDTCGKYIKLSEDKKVAKRTTTFNFGITFSHASIKINELAAFEIVDSSDHWSGEMRLGITKHDPARNLSEELPPNICPYLQNVSGYWVGVLPEGFSKTSNQIALYLNQRGALQIALNGEDFKEFLTGIPTNIPLWIMFEVYGPTTSIQMIDTKNQMNPKTDVQSQLSLPLSSFAAPATIDSDTESIVDMVKAFSLGLTEKEEAGESSRKPDTSFPERASSSDEEVATENEILNMDNNSVLATPRGQVLNQLMEVYNFSLNSLELGQFSSKCGSGASLADLNYAMRIKSVTESCVVFSGAPIVTGQTIYFKIVDTQDKPFTFVGVTSCEPSTLDVDNLPNDANKLLDREEYWKVEMIFSRLHDGDLLAITYGYDGFLAYSVNNTAEGRLCCCDLLKTLWLFLDLSGNIESLYMVGVSING